MKFNKLFIFSLLIAFASCGKTEEIEVRKVVQEPDVKSAVAEVHPVGDSGVTGTVYYDVVDGGVEVRAEISGLEPGKHGFHIHQYGDCTAEDGTSAGGHFNPAEHQHSGPEDVMRHMGDMGNITADEDGNADLQYVDAEIMMDMIIGRGIIVHSGEDDLTTQPTGAAGARLGCGVIGIRQ